MPTFDIGDRVSFYGFTGTVKDFIGSAAVVEFDNDGKKYRIRAELLEPME